MSPVRFLVVIATVNLFLFHYPLFQFAVNSFTAFNASAATALATIALLVFTLSLFLFAICLLISTEMTKWLLGVLWLINAVAMYFITVYDIVLDRTMLGNIFATNFSEAAEFFNFKLLAWFLVLGVLPVWAMKRITITESQRAKVLALAVGSLATGVFGAYLGSSNWLWLDQNAKRLGGLVLPWSYLVNTYRYVDGEREATQTYGVIPPPDSSSDEKSLVLLIIGETARAQNFSHYGYPRDTNPQLRAAGVIALKNTTSCATYTTEALRCMLQPRDNKSASRDRLEPFPTYLTRHDVDVVWRTNNWSEPPLNVSQYDRARDLRKLCEGELCNYDDVLLVGLEARIRASKKQKVLVVLHQRGSHGPAYHKRYPNEFERFTPICTSSDLSSCTPAELVNAYDNSLLYTDSFLSNAIGVVSKIEGRTGSLLYLSDHGESLGEGGLFLHGTPNAFAPKEQLEIPFLIWMSDAFSESRGITKSTLTKRTSHSQGNLYHSVLGALGIRNALYDADLDVFASRPPEKY